MSYAELMSYAEFLASLRRRAAEKAGAVLALERVWQILAMVESDTKELDLTGEDVQTLLELRFKESVYANLVKVSERAGPLFSSVPHAMLRRRLGDYYCWAVVEPATAGNIVHVGWYSRSLSEDIEQCSG